MARKYAGLYVLLIIMLLMSSCHASDPSTPSIPSSISDENRNSGYVSPKDDSRPQLIWAVHATAYISEETQAYIQNYLDEKGINCRIEFTPRIDQTGKSYEKWLNERKKEGTAPDILSGCFWEHGIVDLVPFLKEELLPLNEYLESEAGKKLYNSYAEVEWDRTAVDGIYYSIPFRQRNYQNTQGKYLLCVKDEYKSFFDVDFDGTYASLKKVLETISGSPKIAMMSSLSMNYVAALFQTQFVINAPYCWKNNEIVDLTKQADFKKLLLDIYEDYQSGLLIDIATVDQVTGDVCAYFGFSGDGYATSEGFTEYVLAPELYLSSPGAGSYGVSAISEKKDLAFQVLAACYSDPKVASLLFWRMADEDRWNERTQFLKTCVSSPLSDFLPDITPEEFSKLQSYENDLRALVNKLYLGQAGSRALNPNFPDVVDQFFSSPKDYGPILEKVNDQIQGWIDKKQ